MKLIKIRVDKENADGYELFAETPYSAANIIQSALENGYYDIEIEEAKPEERLEWNQRNRLEIN